MLASSLTGSWVHLALDHLFNQALYFSYFTEMVLGSYDNGPVNKILHYVLPIILGLFMHQYLISQ